MGEPILSSEATEEKHEQEQAEVPAQSETIWNWRFVIILTSLAITSLLTAIESSVTSTALPTISADLNAGEAYIWFVNAFFLSSTAFQPLYGQLAGVFGRRWPLIMAVALFALGSGISGGASSTAMLIAGRTIQGVGLGGVNMLIDIVVSDLVPLRKRGNIMAIIFALFAVGSSVGPFVGGVLTQHASWRWIFYISLPIAGIALALMIPFLKVEYRKETSIRTKLKRIDWIGNLVLVSSIVAVLIALSFAGTLYLWSSWRVILPLVLGFIGLIAFLLLQTTSLCPEPTMPLRLFANRTTFAAFIVAGLHGMLLYWVVYFLPVYFQGVMLSSPTRSGVQLLPTVILTVPAAIVSGTVVTQTGRYKPIQIVGFAFITIGLGLFTLLNSNSSMGAWVGFQIIQAIGSGFVVTSTLPAAQVELPEADVAAITATWAFLRSFGSVWGVSIPSAIFNYRFSSLIRATGNAKLIANIGGGNAFQHASASYVATFPEELQPLIIEGYTGAMKLVWQVSIAFACIGTLVACIEREVVMRTTLETEFGMSSSKTGKSEMRNDD